LTGCFFTAGVLDILIFLDTDRHCQLSAGAANHGVPIDSRDPRVARYVGDQRINLASCDPANRASLVIENTD
jgi:uridine kinase